MPREAVEGEPYTTRIKPEIFDRLREAFPEIKKDAQLIRHAIDVAIGGAHLPNVIPGAATRIRDSGLIDCLLDVKNHNFQEILISNDPLTLALPNLRSWIHHHDHLHFLVSRIRMGLETTLFIPTTFTWEPPHNVKLEDDIQPAIKMIVNELPTSVCGDENGVVPISDVLSIYAYNKAEVGGYIFDVATQGRRYVSPPLPSPQDPALAFVFSGYGLFPTYANSPEFGGSLDVTHFWLEVPQPRSIAEIHR